MKAKKVNIEKYKIPNGKVLVLRSCKEDMTSYNKFTWPESGVVTDSKFRPTVKCGYGLHGFLKGEGDGSLAYWNDKPKWLVLEVEESLIIDLGRKVKFQTCDVIYCGDLIMAAKIMATFYPTANIIGATLTGGYRATLTGGYRATLTGGENSCMIISFYDNFKDRYSRKMAVVGENGIKPNIKYRLNDVFEFEKKKMKAKIRI